MQALLEVPERVRAHALGDRVSLLFGDDVHGVRFIGQPGRPMALIGQTGSQLATLTESEGGEQ